jgi:hypothetical protein
MAIYVGKTNSCAAPRTSLPQLKVNAELPADAPATLGEAVFALRQRAHCDHVRRSGAVAMPPFAQVEGLRITYPPEQATLL